MIFEIVKEPEQMLHRPSVPVKPEEIRSREMKKFVKDMIETMYVKNGVGLAAVQTGKPIQLFTLVKAFNELNKREDLILFNPSWKKLSLHKQSDEEGCLSIPGMYGQKKRYSKILVSGLNKNGEKIEFVAEDFFARIIQHETDHLNGHLYTEGATKVRRIE